MPYLIHGGAAAFRRDTDKIVKIAFKEVRISGSNLTPIIAALQHYEATMAMPILEQQKALCSVLSKCNRWWITKQTKLNRNVGPNARETTVVMRSRRVRSLMQEVMAALNAMDPSLNTAIVKYEQNKAGGSKQGAAPLSAGYANERGAYLAFNKSKSLSASLIDDFLFKSKDRGGRTLPATAETQFNAQYRSKHKELDQLTLSDWKKIDQIASEVAGNQLEVRYMKKFERLKVMLESDGAGGLRYVVGQRSAFSGAGVWAYAMDEYGNIFTADDQLAANKNGYAMFNHSSFTSGDLVICAGMLKIDAGAKLVQIDNSSGHYKPTRAQLQAVVTILQDDLAVDLSRTDIISFEKDPAVGAIAPLVYQWNAGRAAAFLAGAGPG